MYKRQERVRASFFCGLKLEFLYAIFITAVCFFFAEPIIRLFVTDAEMCIRDRGIPVQTASIS